MDYNNTEIIYWLINYLCTCVISVQYTQYRLFVIISTNLCTWCNEQVTSVVFSDVRMEMIIVHYRLYIPNMLCTLYFCYYTLL